MVIVQTRLATYPTSHIVTGVFLIQKQAIAAGGLGNTGIILHRLTVYTRATDHNVEYFIQ